ncbi:MAG TPA: PQQ-binding-like beta-propeller repeat protein [Gemmatimonadota bacterium]|nr:PQQ-binding-like beta-propeller repeat protein [Gemmatimonadota bacterium]
MSIRAPLLAPLFVALLLPGLARAQMDPPAGFRDESPPQARVEPLQSWDQAWKLKLSRGGSAPLVWADSLVLVASLDRNLHLVAPADEPTVRYKKNFKGGFSAAPVVTPRRIYLPELEEGGRLIALDRATGETAWTSNAGDLAASPVLDGSRIYTVSSLGVVAAWTDEGSELWKTDLETRVTARPAKLGNVLVVAATDGRLFAIDTAGGGTVLDSTTPGAGPIWGDPVVLSGADNAGTATAVFATLDGQLLEVGADLAIVRQRSFPSRFYAGPTRSGQRLYLSGHAGAIWSYDWNADAIHWRLDLDNATLRMAPAVGDGHVAVGDLRGELVIVDRERGVVLWSMRLDGALTSTPLFRGDDELFVISEQGTLYAFRPAHP